VLWDIRPNLDGVLSYRIARTDDGRKAARHYCQLFRTGIVEAVHTHLGHENPQHGRIIKPGVTEEWLIDSCTTLLDLLQSLGKEPPIFIMPAFLGFAGYSIRPTDGWGFPMDRCPIDRQLVDIPEVLLESYLPPLQLLDRLRPALDTLWNASGHDEWPGYKCWRRRLQPAG